MDITISKEEALRKLAAMRAEALQCIETAQNPAGAYAWFYSHAGEIDMMCQLGVISSDEHNALTREWFQHNPGRSATHE